MKDECSDEAKSIQRPNIFITDETSTELVYSDLLESIMIFAQNMCEQEGLWREHLKLLQNFDDVIHLFYMPEIHNHLVPLLQKFAIEGNVNIQYAAVKCLAQIYKLQHHAPAREELLEFIIKKLARGKNF